jgi:hypothetical protein
MYKRSTSHASYRASGKVLGGLSLFQSRNALDSLMAGHVGRANMQPLCLTGRYGPHERKEVRSIGSGDLVTLL